MIVGTAGHIDHGKTTLVRALTGVDTDRLPEEKKRGISIELGYAFLDVPASDQRIGFVDVPGHERLVHTMLAGATGIDFALLLVAADDGVMPQTREHLAVLSLLGMARGAVVVTKADRVDTQRVQAVRDEAAALLAGTPLAGAPVLAVSAHSGEGLPALKALLLDAARGAPRTVDPAQAFRLAVDRVFTLDGVGTVATGTVHAGTVRVGDTLRLVPGEREARVRSLHAQNQAVAQSCAGQRCAVALAGVAKDEVSRGQWLVNPAAALATDRFDVALTLWHGEAKPLRGGTPVHVHLGAAGVPGTVAVLDGDTLVPDASGRVQLVLRTPIGAWFGDRVVLRDASASRTLAGGAVLDPFAPQRYRRTPQRLAELDALALPEPAERLAACLASAPHGIELRRFAAAQGRETALEVPAALRHTDAQGDWALGAAQAAAAREALLAALAAYHAKQPDEIGPDASRLRRLAAPRLPEPLWRALLDTMRRDGVLALRGAFVHLPEHGVRLSASEERIAQKAAPQLARAGFEGAWARDLARDFSEPEPLMRTTLARLAQRGELHQVVKDLYYPLATMAKLAAIARQVAAAEGTQQVNAASFRDATGLGRKRAIQILEYFDRVGLLRRVGDVHKLRTDSTLFVEEVMR
ncbi:selenocysteine-specific translation elongation factor [Rhizobacter sp. AJA081-3]|uniref:selenocysteine-specific translation elongation factor n=1 Tax=Rhizobacter sp. AJA081-3 TaxID=2753607 RepID=UPI001AE01379|nr:selenocysteine-specific translation elongation factor [Rhizobacter sp. AJA081-3]QTN21675.1 selenocysteine-specific translation elongation factor [Rhizobacter sp. AJA081-3]